MKQKLTRMPIADILKGIKPNTFYLFRNNLEEFILNISKIIN